VAPDHRRGPPQRPVLAVTQRGWANGRRHQRPYPADPINGFMLGGMDTPGIHSPGFTHPSGLYDQLQRAGIDYVIDVPNLRELSQRDPYQMPLSVKLMVESRARALLHLMGNYPWDVVMAVFVATDRMQHYYWPDAPVSDEHPGWMPLRQLYQCIDAQLGEVLRHINTNTTVLVLSDHGFGPLRPARRGLNALLARLGFLQYRTRGNRLTGKLLKQLLLYGRRYIPSHMQLRLAQALPKLRLQALNEQSYGGIEWSQTRVFADPFGGQVSINQRGRQPEGAVPVQDYERLREEMQEVLSNLTDPLTGRRLRQNVHRREDLYRGPYMEQAADLWIEWDDMALGNKLGYQAHSQSLVVEPPPMSGLGQQWYGAHRSEGIFIARGPAIKPGAAVTDATHYDVTPTILYLQGQPVPKDMDGQVLTDIFTQEHLSAHPIQFSAPASTGLSGTAGLGAEEARQIEERLRNLGYIE
jgi:predicted AlkP superfamily phosphohydrolase/phosphomutase